jgi:hypothetical protein
MTGLNALPTELLGNICQHLALADVIGLSEVNRRLRQICSDPFISTPAIKVGVRERLLDENMG